MPCSNTIPYSKCWDVKQFKWLQPKNVKNFLWKQGWTHILPVKCEALTNAIYTSGLVKTSISNWVMDIKEGM